jgi:hypothetical protein
MLDEFKVYEVVPASQAVGQELISSRGEAKTTGDGTIKWRFVGREFKWMQVRDDVFSPGSSINTSRTIDFVAAKEQWPTQCADGISAYCQTPEKAERYTVPPKEWMWLRQQQGEDTDVVWRLRKKLPGTRDAGACFTQHLADLFAECGLERNAALHTC